MCVRYIAHTRWSTYAFRSTNTGRRKCASIHAETHNHAEVTKGKTGLTNPLISHHHINRKVLPLLASSARPNPESHTVLFRLFLIILPSFENCSKKLMAIEELTYSYGLYSLQLSARWDQYLLVRVQVNMPFSSTYYVPPKTQDKLYQKPLGNQTKNTSFWTSILRSMILLIIQIAVITSIIIFLFEQLSKG